MSEDQTYFVSGPEPDDDKFLHITEVSRFDDFAYLRFRDFTMPDGTKIIMHSTPYHYHKPVWLNWLKSKIKRIMRWMTK